MNTFKPGAHLALAVIAGLAAAGAACESTTLDLCVSDQCPTDGSGGGGDAARDGSGIKWDAPPVNPDKLLPDSVPQCASGYVACGGVCCDINTHICLSNKCLKLGPNCSELWPCPAGYYCDKTTGRCIPGANKCQYKPPVGVFAPQVKWEWQSSTEQPAYNQVMMAPMVINLTDDNKDGKIDRNDVPDIVFHTYKGSAYTTDGVMRVISGDGKGEHLAITKKLQLYRTHPGTQIALGDIDGDKKSEMVACASGGGVIAFEHDGTFKWKNTGVSCNAPSIADLDGDGQAEVISCYAAIRGSTGKTWWQNSGCTYTTVADIDEDGKPEVVGGNKVYHHDGTLYWSDAKRPDGYVAISDLDGDGKPEIITASSSDHGLRAYHHDGKPAWTKMPVDINQGKGTGSNQSGGGPPTVADFDGDGKPEIAAAAGWGYVIFEHDGTPKWFQKTKDLSSRVTGSSVFDFEGDGKAEVVYADEHELRIYRGSDGVVLKSFCNTSGTLVEYPIIVDVDNDGHAEIVVANNNYAFKTCPDSSASHTGIKVLTDTKYNWVKTRRIWNQHTYHITNISEDGIVPTKEPRNWDNPYLNNFRQNVQPGGLFDAPDLTGDTAPIKCTVVLQAEVLVKNQGAAKVAAGIPVSLYGSIQGGAYTLLKTVLTKTQLIPGQSEKVSFSLTTPKSFSKEHVTLQAVVDDDGTGKGKANECNEKNNTVQLGKVFCPGVG